MCPCLCLRDGPVHSVVILGEGQHSARDVIKEIRDTGDRARRMDEHADRWPGREPRRSEVVMCSCKARR